LTKALSRLLTESVTLIPGVIGLRYAENTGVAFGLLAGQPRLLGIFSLILSAAGVWYLHRRPLKKWPMISAMLMLGGAVGNMIDRFLWGYVVDMVEFLFVRFAIFNLADAALCCGCALMAFSLVFRPRDWSDTHHGSTDEHPL